MSKRFNEPNHTFIIETSESCGLHLCYWRIDQVLDRPGNDAAIERLRNQVECHLDKISKRLGLSVGIVVEGPLKAVDLIIENFGYNID
jgi:hypothetical protein